jgi:hypothetical protein
MARMKFRSSLHLVCVFLGFFVSSGLASGAPVSEILTKKLDFPWPVQWKVGGIEVSLIGVAWGRANSPDMIAKSREDFHVQKPEFYPDRPSVLALNFRAKVPNVVSTSISAASSGLGRVKNVDGDIEAPMELTQLGFVPFSGSPGVFDIRFNRDSTTEYWDLFPSAPDQKEFLFEVISSGSNFVPGRGTSTLSFKIVRKDDDFIIINASPGAETSCLRFNKNYTGTAGADIGVKLQLTREGATVSGTEQYLRVGKTLWLQGTADSLGNLVLEERYPKDQETGIFKGHFSMGCQMISGFFSKPDGSRLQPFEFREAGAGNKSDANGPDPRQQ